MPNIRPHCHDPPPSQGGVKQGPGHLSLHLTHCSLCESQIVIMEFTNSPHLKHVVTTQGNTLTGYSSIFGGSGSIFLSLKYYSSCVENCYTSLHLYWSMPKCFVYCILHCEKIKDKIIPCAHFPTVYILVNEEALK